VESEVREREDDALGAFVRTFIHGNSFTALRSTSLLDVYPVTFPGSFPRDP